MRASALDLGHDMVGVSADLRADVVPGVLCLTAVGRAGALEYRSVFWGESRQRPAGGFFLRVHRFGRDCAPDARQGENYVPRVPRQKRDLDLWCSSTAPFLRSRIARATTRCNGDRRWVDTATVGSPTPRRCRARSAGPVEAMLSFPRWIREGRSAVAFRRLWFAAWRRRGRRCRCPA